MYIFSKTDTVVEDKTPQPFSSLSLPKRHSLLDPNIASDPNVWWEEWWPLLWQGLVLEEVDEL